MKWEIHPKLMDGVLLCLDFVFLQTLCLGIVKLASA